MFVPVHDVGNPIHRIDLPYVTYLIIAVNVLVFFWLNGPDVAAAEGTLLLLSFHHGDVVFMDGTSYEGVVLPGIVSAMTSAFVHVDFWHLLGNMLFLWVFADNVEDAVGHWKFLAFYLLAALAAAYAQALFTEPGYILFGASGAVSAVIAAFLMLHPNVRVWILVFMKIPVRLTAFWVIGAWILWQFFNVFVDNTDTAVGWWAHIGGLAAGAALLPLLKRKDVPLFDRGRAGPSAPA